MKYHLYSFKFAKNKIMIKIKDENNTLIHFRLDINTKKYIFCLLKQITHNANKIKSEII